MNRLRCLDLTENKFEYLNEEIVNGLLDLEHIELNSHPWMETSSARRFKTPSFQLEPKTFSGLSRTVKFISLCRLGFLNRQVFEGLENVESLVSSVYSGTIFEQDPPLVDLVKLQKLTVDLNDLNSSFRDCLKLDGCTG